jgi:uncharacterized membrane protein
MSTGVQARERDRALDRYLTFIDAVVAIAITLLVLPLTELGADLGEDESVAHLLHEHQAAIWTFLLSFVVVANLWFGQHRALRSLVDLNGAVSRSLLVWVLTIVMLPFFTELVAEAADDPTTKLLYFGAIVIATGCVAVVETSMSRHPEITDGGRAPHVGRAWTTVALLVAAAALTLAVPALSYWPLLLLRADNVVLAVRRRAGRGPRRG